MMLYENFTTGPITATAQGKQVFALDTIEANLNAAEDQSKFDFDATGHYARPDVFQLVVDTKAKPAVRSE